MKPRRWPWLCLLPLLGARAEPASFEAFLQWLQGRGASFGAKFGLGPDPATGLRGMLSGERIRKDQDIFTLPSEVVLTADVVQAQGEAWQQCTSGGEEKPDVLGPTHTSFALFILEQRAPGSPWRPWVSVLPESFEGFPLFYGDEDLAALQASPVRRVIELDKNAVAHDHAVAAKTMSGLTLEEFRWARTAVKSRVFGLRSLSGGTLKEERIAMVPLADFVNHPPDGVVEANVAPSYDAATGAFRLRAIRDIKAGEGLYWDYGFKSNRHSLLRYGFANLKRIGLTDMPLFFKLSDFPGPPGGAKTMKLGAIQSAQESGALAMEQDGTVMHELALTLTGAAAERLIGHMRFMVYQPRNASLLAELCGTTYCRPIGLANERQALQHFVSVLQSLLDSYGTTVAQDKELVEGGKLEQAGGAAWHGLVVRYGEKHILRGFTKLLQALDPLFDLSPWALSRTVADKWNDAGSDIHRYVQETLTSLVEAEGIRWAKRKVKEMKAQGSP